MIYNFITKFGRKFALSIFAGASSFIVTVAGLWIAARVTPETATIIERLVGGYLFAAAGMVTAYAGTNAWVENAHARAGTATPKAPPSQSGRASGTVQGAESE